MPLPAKSPPKSPFALVQKLFTWLLILVSISFVVNVATVTVDVNQGETAAAQSNLKIRVSDSLTINAYLARPKGIGQQPAILMLHDIWGLNETIAQRAEKLAEHGYVVLAVDVFRGDTTSYLPTGMWLSSSTRPEQVLADMQAAYNYLMTLPDVNPDRIGIIGFGYGGEQAVRFANFNINMRAVVNISGAMFTDPAEFRALLQSGAPVMALFGANDPQRTTQAVASFQAALNRANISNQVVTYMGTGGDFVRPEANAPEVSRQAWADVVAFLNTYLK